jgi:alcohol dehydrogenase (cytochrome c)
MDFIWRPKEEWELNFVLRPKPGNDGNFGALIAVDLDQRKTAWIEQRRAPSASSALATAGGLVFEGDRDRWFRASDEETGRVLWETRLDNVPSSSPITYSAGDQQYVSISTGGGGPMDASRIALTPEIDRSAPSVVLWVFKLPGDGASAAQ